MVQRAASSAIQMVASVRQEVTVELALVMLKVAGVFFFFQAEDGIRDYKVTGVQTCALPISPGWLQGVTRSLASATMARNSLLGLKTGTGRAATSTGSPVRGLRAMRVLRWRILNVPNPRTSMLCCSDSAALTASRKESTTRAQSFLEIRGPAV